MDARGRPAEDLTSFLNGFEFGLAVIQGRLDELGPDPTGAELQAAVDSYRALAEEIRADQGTRAGARRELTQPRRR